MTSNSRQRFALLVGVDFYLNDNSRTYPNGDPVALTNLKGCVQDVQIIRCLLQTTFGLDQPRIRTLTSSLAYGENDFPPELEDEMPTLNNIERAFDEIYDQAQAGDLFLFSFSGHGALLEPIPNQSPAERDKEPSLMTADYCCRGPAIRGWQLNNWLAKFTKKGIRVVVVLDSCYSGGAWRVDRQTRSPEDWKPPPNLPPDEAAVQGTQTKPGSRYGDLEMNWDINTEGLTLMAACRTTQRAEEEYQNGKFCGRFTGALQAYLQKQSIPSMRTYRAICGYIAGSIQPQEPEVFGQDRLVFFGDYEPFAATPIFVRIHSNGIDLPIGRAHGVVDGAQFTTYSPAPRVILSAREVEDFESKAEVHEGHMQRHFLEELTAVIPFRWSIPGILRIYIDPHLGQWFRKQLSFYLHDRLVGEIEVVEYTGPPTDEDLSLRFWLRPAESGNIEIFGPKALLGSQGSVRGWNPMSYSDDSGAADYAVALAHLTRFDQILRLKDECSQDSQPFTVTLNPDLKNGSVQDKQKFNLKFQNNYTEDLFFSVIILSSGFHVKQLFPPHDGAYAVQSRYSWSFNFDLTIPEELKDNGRVGQQDMYRDIIRIVTTSGKGLSLKSLELPDIWNARQADCERRTSLERYARLLSDCKWWVSDHEAWLVRQD